MAETLVAETRLFVDLSLTRASAVQRVAYALADRFDVEVLRTSNTEATLLVRRQKDGPVLPTDAELRRLLLDFTLRLDIEEKTRDVRTLLVKAALSHAG